jgi:hypothetical protein
MLSRLHNKLGTAGLVMAIVALVAALGGAAWAAADNHLSGGEKKEVKKIAQKFAKGATGPAGAQGPTGPQGPQGAPGKNGTDGTNGEDGEDGKSVTVTPIAPGEEECEELGGALVEEEGEPASATEVCNGQTGFTETLPSGKTETGTFSAREVAAAPGSSWETVSFNIPLAEAPALHYEAPEFPASDKTACEEESEPEKAECLAELEEEEEDCPGSFGEPQAAPGNLCFYAFTEFKTSFSEIGVALNVGAFLRFDQAEPVGVAAFGTWAVTAS